MRNRSGSIVVWIALSLGCAADSGAGDEASSAGPNDPCVPGQSSACTCEGGVPGAQVCEPDGIGYGPCVCEDADTGAVGEGRPTDTSPDDSEDDAVDENPDDDGGDGGPSESEGGETSEDDGVPSWTDDIVPLLEKSCGAGIDGCHSRAAYNAEVDKGCLNWVSYEDVPLGSVFYSGDRAGESTGCPDLPLYDRIVNRSPWQCGAFFNAPTAVLIAPFDPEGSYTIQKIKGMSCDNGTAMPPPEQGIQISEADVAMLTAWIAAGAPYDE